MGREIVVRTFLIGMMVLALSTATSSQKAVKRDLKLYADGGKFDFSWRQFRSHEEMSAGLREFLWSAWKLKRRSTVRANFYSIEGDPTKYRIFVEPAKSGNWRVVVRLERWCCWFDALSRPRRKRRFTATTEVYNLVERVDRVEEKSPGPIGSLWSWKPIPFEESRTSDNYFLLFRKNSSHRIGWEL